MGKKLFHSDQFMNMSVLEQRYKLKSKNLCTGCLYPGAKDGPLHHCFFTKFFCPSHEEKDKIHILLCDEYKSNDRNKELLRKYKDKFINNSETTLPPFAKTLSFFSGKCECMSNATSTSIKQFETHPDIKESAIFQLQKLMWMD